MLKIFCKHDYELVFQKEMKSEFEKVIEAGLKPTTHNSTQSLIITDYRCKKCGKLKRLTAKH